MPELPEVEITKRGIEQRLLNALLTKVIIRQTKLRKCIPRDFASQLKGQYLKQVSRRAKYLFLWFEQNVVLIHLGMSGSLRLCAHLQPAILHDHVDLQFGEIVLRYHDPRRFGYIDIIPHSKLEQIMPFARMGPEPLTEQFNSTYLFHYLSGRTRSIKSLLMDDRCVVGIGNIYACESLFRARIHPFQQGRNLSFDQCQYLVQEIKATLQAAIAAGGSSLKDFVHLDGQTGYFQQSYFVYRRNMLSCKCCGHPIQRLVQQQRATFFCPHCQHE